MNQRFEKLRRGKENVIESDGSESKERLSPLPFKYEETDNPEKADYREWRISPVVFDGKENQPKSDEEIVESIKKQHEAKEWYTSAYWREKGTPLEQLDITIDGHPIIVYNYNEKSHLTEEHVVRTISSLEKIVKSFPSILDKIRWILIDDEQPPSLLGEEDLYPTNGEAMEEKKAFYLTPKGMRLVPHRVEEVSNFEGTLIHELGHLLQDKFKKEWSEEFSWEYCWEDKERWELKKTKSGQYKFFDRTSGEIAPQGQYPLQPDQCVTDYAKQNIAEDICESLVVYFFNPERLKKISPAKFAILKKYDSDRKKIEVLTTKKEKVELPEIRPQVINYYVEENN